MRVPVYPRGADPRTSRRILKKSFSFAAKQVEDCLADWVDPADPSQGIVPREFLQSGRVYSATPEPGDLSPPPDVGLKFIPPPMEKNPTLPRVNVETLLSAAQGWDWNYEHFPF